VAKYNQSDEVKEDEMRRACSTNGEKKHACTRRILVGKLEGKRQLGHPRRRWVDIIKTDLREIGWSCVDWIDLAQDRDQWRVLVNMAMNLRVPQNFGNILSSYTTGGFTTKAQLHEFS
jgi:hypothetical protein